jgi:gluconate 2-dehydrogenase gamma chain
VTTEQDSTPGRASLDRREAVKVMALLPFATSWEITPPQLERALEALTSGALDPRTGYVPQFFRRAEWATVNLLADYVIPADERSGSATDAKAPEYIDFLMADPDASHASRTAMRGGLAWLDFECEKRFGKTFVDVSDGQRRAVLDDIAWPARARPEMSHGVAFFNRFRDLTAAGFFSTAMGWRDLRFIGNAFVPSWTGCPQDAMDKLGVSQEVMKTRVPVQHGR